MSNTVTKQNANADESKKNKKSVTASNINNLKIDDESQVQNSDNTLPEISLKNVNKKYKIDAKKTFHALHNLNVDFFKGELVSIMGESGSGKSTLMNLIGGLDSDFSGDILVDGKNLRTLSDKQLDKYRKNHVGFVFQSFNLIPHLSILDNVTLALTLSNVGEKQRVEKATEILKRVGLSSHLKKKPTQLSGGQKQRVAIARALINDPEIIIADEPTGALDSETSMQILQILKEIADGGKLVIMVTHSEKVASVCSRVLEISDGKIISDHKNAKYKKFVSTNNGNAAQTEEITKDNLTHNKQISSTDDLELAENSKNNSIKKNANTIEKSENKKKKWKDKQNLSFISAIRLSFHNMWASKTKNFLMSFGVAIGIGSLILMMCFSSGITDFITKTMTSYSDPTIVTISKKGSGNDMTSLFTYSYFTDEEKEELIDDINTYLTEKNIDFQLVDDGKNGKDGGNVVYGIQMMTMAAGATVVFNPERLSQVNEFGVGDVDYFNEVSDTSKWLSNSELANNTIIYMYTIPPYYTNTNVVSGEMSTSENGIMFTKSILQMFENQSIKDEDGNNRKVDIAFKYNNTKLIFSQQEITGIMDASVMSNYMVMYIDYDYFQTLFSGNSNTNGEKLNPNVLYVKTNDEKITNVINDYLNTLDGYTGSIEDQFATMFTSMSSVIGTSLVVISCISLIVSAMMILVVLYMSVTERTKEIGVLKSIGARRKDIRRIFTSESFLIGILSGVIGIVFNLILTLIVYLVLINTIGLAPISYRWWYFAIAIGVSVVISMLSGLYPASKAAKLDPVESLRRE